MFLYYLFIFMLNIIIGTNMVSLLTYFEEFFYTSNTIGTDVKLNQGEFQSTSFCFIEN